MPMIQVPFAQADAPPPPVAPGLYLAECTAATLGTVQKQDSKIFGSTFIRWEWTICDPNTPEFIGRRLPHNSNLNNTAKKEDGTPDEKRINQGIYFLREYLDAIGCPYDKETGQFNTDDALNCKAIIEVIADTWNGKPTARIQRVLAVPQH